MFTDLGATVSKYYNFLRINLCITDNIQVIKAKLVLLLVVDWSEKELLVAHNHAAYFHNKEIN